MPERSLLCRRFAGFLASCVILLNSAATFAFEQAAVAKALASVTETELKQHVEVLADDTFEGREAGSRGGHAAANYLANLMRAHGLSVAGEGRSYFQPFNGTSKNILGLLEGSDPQLKQEVIVIGAHYDHVGYGRPNNSFGPTGYIHNGADDNASGVAGLIEILDAIKQLPAATKRSILFCFWDGEEAGLLGSRHWTAQPTLPLDRVKCYLNLDMIGRLKNDKIEVYGTRTAAGFRKLVSEANRETNLELDFTWKMKEDSDHHSFYIRSIPTLMFHTGLHEDYHRPSDDAHKINHLGMQKVARLTLQVLIELADGDESCRFRTECRQETIAQQLLLERPVMPPPARFGMPWQAVVMAEPANQAGPVVSDIAAPTTPIDPPAKLAKKLKLRLLGAIADSPADHAGIKAGDVVVKYEGAEIIDENRLRLELLAAKGPKTFTIERAGVEGVKEFTITPRGEPIRAGIYSREDPAEPSMVLVTQVAVFSAAQLAGLQVADRIYAVDGQNFRNSNDFGQLLQAAKGPVQLTLEHRGKLKTVQLDVLPLEVEAP